MIDRSEFIRGLSSFDIETLSPRDVEEAPGSAAEEEPNASREERREQILKQIERERSQRRFTPAPELRPAEDSSPVRESSTPSGKPQRSKEERDALIAQMLKERRGRRSHEAATPEQPPASPQVPLPTEPGFAEWIMKRADRHARNQMLTVNELHTFLPNHPFTAWLSRSKFLR